MAVKVIHLGTSVVARFAVINEKDDAVTEQEYTVNLSTLSPGAFLNALDAQQTARENLKRTYDGGPVELGEEAEGQE